MIRTLASLAIMASLALPAQAQFSDEIVVTGTRTASIPGVRLEVKGDFLIDTLTVFNDSREPDIRRKEIEATLERVAKAAKANSRVELSILVDDDRVRPFSYAAAIEAIVSGSQPDTSYLEVLAKTPIAANTTSSFELTDYLESFAKGIDTVGRSSIYLDEDPQVSVTNPSQYRTRLLKDIIAEIRQISSGLSDSQTSDGYGAIIDGIDGELEITRGSDVSLILYIPYTYRVVPDNITTIVAPYEN